MPRKFTQIAFTPAVKAAQEQRGSRETYARFEQNGPENDTVTPEIEDFIAQLDGFYLGTVSSNGYPYIQFRGGSPGFLKVLDKKTLGFGDFKGNIQYVTVGNLSENDKGDNQLIERLKVPGYEAEIERGILFHIEAWNWNCPQHIPIRYSQQEVDAMQARIAELEQLLANANQLS
jgi:uncharacterized protein